jgi:hypothetical protein
MGKVRPNFSGRNHPGNIDWPILPKHLRGKIIKASDAPKAPRKGAK